MSNSFSSQALPFHIKVYYAIVQKLSVIQSGFVRFRNSDSTISSERVHKQPMSSNAVRIHFVVYQPRPISTFTFGLTRSRKPLPEAKPALSGCHLLNVHLLGLWASFHMLVTYNIPRIKVTTLSDHMATVAAYIP